MNILLKIVFCKMVCGKVRTVTLADAISLVWIIKYMLLNLSYYDLFQIMAIALVLWVFKAFIGN